MTSNMYTNFQELYLRNNPPKHLVWKTKPACVHETHKTMVT